MQSSPRFLFFSSEEYAVLLNLKIVLQFIKVCPQLNSTYKPILHVLILCFSQAHDKKREMSYYSSIDSTSQQSQSIFSIDTDNILVEASWSQFVIIMWMLSLGRPEEIPPLAYNITDNLHLLHAEMELASESRMSPHKAAMAAAAAASPRQGSPVHGGTPMETDWEKRGVGDESFFETTRRPTSRGSDMDSPAGNTPMGSPSRPTISKRQTVTAGNPVRESSPQGLDRHRESQFNKTAPPFLISLSDTSVGGPSLNKTSRDRTKHQPPSLAEKFK